MRKKFGTVPNGTQISRGWPSRIFQTGVFEVFVVCYGFLFAEIVAVSSDSLEDQSGVIAITPEAVDQSVIPAERLGLRREP